MPSTYALEPELEMRPPRQIVSRKYTGAVSSRRSAVMWFVRLFLLPFIAVGLSLFVLLIYRGLLPIASVAVPAVVTSLDHTSDSDGDYYKANFSYSYAGSSYAGTSHVMPDVYSQMSVGQRGQAEFLPWFPGFQPRLSNPPGDLLFGSVGGLVYFTLFWNGLVAMFVWTIFIWPGIYRRIYTEGVPAMATITEKKTQSGEDSTDYLLIYQFTPVDVSGREGNPLQGRSKVAQHDWDPVQVGQTFTVLYLPKRPRWNELYQFGSYRIIR